MLEKSDVRLNCTTSVFKLKAPSKGRFLLYSSLMHNFTKMLFIPGIFCLIVGYVWATHALDSCGFYHACTDATKKDLMLAIMIAAAGLVLLVAAGVHALVVKHSQK